MTEKQAGLGYDLNTGAERKRRIRGTDACMHVREMRARREQDKVAETPECCGPLRSAWTSWSEGCTRKRPEGGLRGHWAAGNDIS
jgi:hypothetical protein